MIKGSGPQTKIKKSLRIDHDTGLIRKNKGQKKSLWSHWLKKREAGTRVNYTIEFVHFNKVLLIRTLCLGLICLSLSGNAVQRQHSWSGIQTRRQNKRVYVRMSSNIQHIETAKTAESNQVEQVTNYKITPPNSKTWSIWNLHGYLVSLIRGEAGARGKQGATINWNKPEIESLEGYHGYIVISSHRI